MTDPSMFEILGVVALALVVVFFVVSLVLIFVFKKKGEEGLANEQQALVSETEHLKKELLSLRNELTAAINSVRSQILSVEEEQKQQLQIAVMDIAGKNTVMQGNMQAVEQNLNQAQANLNQQMVGIQQEYKQYFNDFRGEVSKEVDFQFKSENMEPRLNAFREETDRKFQEIGDEKVAEHANKQTHIYEAMNQSLDTLNEEGRQNQADWEKKLQGCQEKVTAHCNAEFAQLTARSNQFCENSYKEYEARLSADNNRLIQDFSNNFNAQSQAIVNSCTERTNQACARVEQQAANSTAVIASSLATAQQQCAQEVANFSAQFAEMERSTRKTIDDNNSWFECEMNKQIKNKKWELEESISSKKKDMEKTCKDVEWRIDSCEKKIQDCEKQVKDCDWWIRENDKKIKASVKDLEALTEASVNDLDSKLEKKVDALERKIKDVENQSNNNQW